MKYLSKITMKDLCGGKIEIPAERTHIATIIGEVSAINKKNNPFEPERSQLKFMGHFEGVIAATGEVFESETAYFTESLSELVASKGTGAQFAFKIFINPAPKSERKYAFDFERVFQTAPSERFKALRAAAGLAEILATPAPAPEPAPEPSPEPVAGSVHDKESDPFPSPEPTTEKHHTKKKR